MNTIDETFNAKRTVLQSRRDQLTTELERIQDDLSILNRAWELISDDPEPEKRRVVTVEDVEDCKTQTELAERVVHLSGGPVKVKEVAQLAFDTGNWKGKFASLNSTMYNIFRKDEEKYEWAGPGSFRLRNGQHPST